MRNSLRKILACCGIAVLSFILWSKIALSEDVDGLNILVNEVSPVKVNSPQRVLISNPAIADVNIVSDNEILVKGIAEGQTKLLVWEGNNQRTIPINVFSEDPQKIIAEIQSQLFKSNIKGIVVKEENGKVLASGELISKEDLDIATAIIGKYKTAINLVRLKEDRPLVEVNVQVLEMSATMYKTMGFDWPTSYRVDAYPPAGTAKNLSDVAGIANWSTANNTLNTKINLTITEGKTKVLSRPHLVTLSGKEASVLVGGQVPVVTTTATSISTSENVEYKDYGIKLTILPTVMEKDRVKVHVKAEVSDIDESRAYQRTATQTIPAFTTRTAETELYLKTNESVIIAGLIKQKDSEILNRVPFLSKVPVLGEFFSKRSISSSTPNEDTELIITITPKIIRTEEEKPKEAQILESWEEKKAKEELPPSLVKASPQVFEYSASVQKRVNEGIYYPYAARHAKIEGMVKLSLHILANGDLLDVVVRESSGYKVLDNAAIDAARSQAPYPRFPPGLSLKELWVDIPVVYRIGTKTNVR